MLKRFLIELLLSSFAFTTIANLDTIQNEKDIENYQLVENAEVESDGLYNPEILELYETAVNNDNTYLSDFYAPTYFKNLRTNFGNNTKGSCGYVATGMLLSFCDTYFTAWCGSWCEQYYSIFKA